jgi:hypothetical protein
MIWHMESKRPARAEPVLHVMRQTRWWVLVVAIGLSSFAGPWFWLTVPAALLWLTPLLVDSVRAFHTGVHQES